MSSSQDNMNILYRVMKYVLDTKDKGLFLKPKFEDENKFVFLGFCDSNWGSNKYDRNSVSGYSIYYVLAPYIRKSIRLGGGGPLGWLAAGMSIAYNKRKQQQQRSKDSKGGGRKLQRFLIVGGGDEHWL